MSDTPKPDGGPAFPSWVSNQSAGGGFTWNQLAPGMTLRDYFAAQALLNATWIWRNVMTEEDVAQNAYRVADAMLKKRNKP